MNEVILLWLSIIVITVFGILAHFLYDFVQIIHSSKSSNKTPTFETIKPLGLFTAINESTWEHIKIAITPTILWGLVDGYLYGADSNYFPAKFISLLILIIFIPLVYYSYRYFTKHSILLFDIIIFITAIIFAQLAFFNIINCPAIPYWVSYLATIGVFIFFGAYMTLTLAPLKSIIFKDPVTGKYGFPAHRNFFKSLRTKQRNRPKTSKK